MTYSHNNYYKQQSPTMRYGGSTNNHHSKNSASSTNLSTSPGSTSSSSSSGGGSGGGFFSSLKNSYSPRTHSGWQYQPSKKSPVMNNNYQHGNSPITNLKNSPVNNVGSGNGGRRTANNRYNNNNNNPKHRNSSGHNNHGVHILLNGNQRNGYSPPTIIPTNLTHYAGSKCFDAPAPTALPKPPQHWTIVKEKKSLTTGSSCGGGVAFDGGILKSKRNLLDDFNTQNLKIILNVQS